MLTKWKWIVPLVFLLIACGEKKEGSVVQEETGATMDIMIVFAPGQLGDRGYADSVMEGLSLLNAMDKNYEHNLLELQFISAFDAADTQESMQHWLENPVNPFYGNEYEKRLLVLTEPYMVKWLEAMVSKIRQTDEVLLLKVNDEDVDAAAEATGLDGRIHGLNISAADNIRRYCTFARHFSEENELPLEEIPIFRIFDEKAGNYHYRDSVELAFKKEFGDEVNTYPFSLVEEMGGDEAVFSTQTQGKVMEMAYEMAGIMHELCEEDDMCFGVVDLGSANAGFDYYLMRLYGGYRLHLLMLDAMSDAGVDRYWINRRFDKALLLWGYTWSQSPVGAMPKMVLHSRRDGYSEDNLPL